MATNILSLDVGTSRVGVAIASQIARLPRALTTLHNDELFWQNLEQLLASEDIGLVVVGLPRNLSGDDTAQTTYVREFATHITTVPTVFQDEALTSVKAEAELKQRGKQYQKGDIDALAATYILEDYLSQQGVGLHE